MANIIGIKTLNGIWIIQTDTNPTLTGGVVAPISSFAIALDGSGTFYKSAVAPTGWTRLSEATDVISHLALSNLTTGNAGHTQFMMLDGSTPMAANLNMGGFSLTNYGTFNSFIYFANNQGIDVVLSGGSDVLNIGTANADVINIGYSGSVVNINGTLSYQNVDNLAVKDKLFTVNKGGGVASGASAGFEIEEGGVITGWFDTSGTRAGWDFKAPASQQLTLNLAALTASRILSAPDVAGTIATINGGQTFTSATWQASTINVLYGGTGTSTQFTAGSIVFAGAAGVYSQDNANLFWDDANNRLGIGTAAPTAFCDLPASTTGASSMRIRAGVAPTTPNAGDMWHSSTQKTFSLFLNGLTESVSTVLFSSTADLLVTGSGTTETSMQATTGIGTTTLPANFFVAGKTIRCTIRGYHNKGAGNITIRAKLGTTNVCVSGSINSGAATNAGFIIQFLITCRTTGVGGTVFAQGSFVNQNGGASVDMVSTAAVVVDTTAAKIVGCSIQYATSNVGNTITNTNTVIEVLN